MDRMIRAAVALSTTQPRPKKKAAPVSPPKPPLPSQAAGEQGNQRAGERPRSSSLTQAALPSQCGEVITLTMGDCAENHRGNQMIGDRVEAGEGFTYDDLLAIQRHFRDEWKCETEMVQLHDDDPVELADGSTIEQEVAFVLVMRQGVNALFGQPDAAERMYAEQTALEWDKKCMMYGRVVNKHARHNLCYSEEAQEPDYEKGKGRIIPFHQVPMLQSALATLEACVGPKARHLKVEGNRYYDISQCGIGWHSDIERRKVISIRLGTVGTPIHFQWYLNSQPMGERMTIDLQPGDMYVMSEKAVAPDGKKKKIPILRHAVGPRKFSGLVD